MIEFFCKNWNRSVVNKVLSFSEILSKQILLLKLVKWVKSAWSWFNLEQRNQKVSRRVAQPKF